jgi:hypothetical protein
LGLVFKETVFLGFWTATTGFFDGGIILGIFAFAGFLTSFFDGAATGAAAGPAAGALPGMDTRLTLTTVDENRFRGPDWGIKINVPRKTR